MSVLWIVNERWNCTSAWFQANTQGQSTLDQDPRDHDRDGHKVSLSGIKLQFVSRKSWRRKWNMTSIHTSKGLALLYRAWWKHFLCLWLWHTLARVDKGAFLPSPGLKATSRAWLSFSASPSNMREMPSRRSLHQLLPPQQTASMWRLNSQRCWKKHSLPTFLCKTSKSLHCI